jgi:hypothetical protein
MAKAGKQPTSPPEGQLTLAGMNGAVAGKDFVPQAASRLFLELVAAGQELRDVAPVTPRGNSADSARPRQAEAPTEAVQPKALKLWEDLAFCAREFVLVTLPHKDPGPEVDVFQRRNGRLTLTVQSGVDSKTLRKVGIPYGSIPRLFLYYANTQVLKNRDEKDRRIAMGKNLAEFLRELGLESKSGGRNSSAHSCRAQMTRLLMARLSYVIEQPPSNPLCGVARQDMLVSSRSVLWWDEQNPDSLWEGESWIELGREFHEMMRTGPIPVRISVLQAIKKSPLALDLYALLTRESARAAKSGKPHFISWSALMGQIGAEYTDPKDFGKYARIAIAAIKQHYPKLKLGDRKGGIDIRPDSLPDVDLIGGK